VGVFVDWTVAAFKLNEVSLALAAHVIVSVAMSPLTLKVMVFPVCGGPSVAAGITATYRPTSFTLPENTSLSSIKTCTLVSSAANCLSTYAKPDKKCGRSWAETITGILKSIATKTKKKNTLVRVNFIDLLSTAQL
jgi:hypothetical protein